MLLTEDGTGRKEVTTFFYLYMAVTMFSLVLDAGVIPPGSGVFPYFVALQVGLASALCICLFINGFVGFQLYEDGTTLSVWLVRLCSTAWFVVTGAVALFTFKGWAGLGPKNAVGLFVVSYIINGLFLVIYVIMQILLVANTLQDRWPLFDIAFGVTFFVIGQVILYIFSNMICESASHYLDGLFFSTFCNLLAVMMVYKVGSGQKSACLFKADSHLVLGLDHKRRSRIQRRHKTQQLGSQGAIDGRGQKDNALRRQ
jgi:Chitin synthase export chaperone